MKLPGTNAQQVQGICDLIRGIALNYPAGLPELRRQLDQVDPQEPSYVIPSPLDESAERWQPPTDPTPQAKRGPGRPPGSKNKANQ